MLLALGLFRGLITSPSGPASRAISIMRYRICAPKDDTYQYVVVWHLCPRSLELPASRAMNQVAPKRANSLLVQGQPWVPRTPILASPNLKQSLRHRIDRSPYFF